MLVPATIPTKVVSTGRIDSREVKAVFSDLLRLLEASQKVMARAVNANLGDYVSQNDRPTPDEGHSLVWHDADAGAGQPKAYIVTTQGGVTYTFASVETV